MFNLTNSMEINVLTPNVDMGAVSNFAVKNRCPAVVAMPELIPMMMVDRAAKHGQYKLIAAIDFPAGRNYCLDKFKSIEVGSLGADGMDIIMTKGRTHVESKNEAKTLIEFLKGHLGPLLDIRFVFGCYSTEWKTIENFLDAAADHPPNMIRIDQHLSVPNMKFKTHKNMIGALRKRTPKRLKVSGDIDLGMIEALRKIDKNLVFDVSLHQATHILNQVKQRSLATGDN
jgi:hypothetical protein